MMNTDMALAFPLSSAETPGAPVSGYLNQICGPNSVGLTNPRDPISGIFGCTNGNTGKGQSTTVPSTANTVQKYIFDNQLFLNDFAKSFNKMTSVGYTNGKLGSLTNIDLTKC